MFRGDAVDQGARHARLPGELRPAPHGVLNLAKNVGGAAALHGGVAGTGDEVVDLEASRACRAATSGVRRSTVPAGSTGVPPG